MLKDSERTLTEKLKESRKEMEKMTTIINQLWPFIQSHLRKEIGSTKIANLKKMAKEESRINFLDTLSNVIARVKKDAEKEGRSLFGTDLETKYEQLKRDYSKFDQAEKELKHQLKDKDRKDQHSKQLIDKLKKRVKELDAFRLTTTDYVMTKATSQEEILFLVRANERISAFQEKDLLEGDEKFEDGGFITRKRHYEVLDDYEPAPSFLKTLTNEILYLESNENDSLLQEANNWNLLDKTYTNSTIDRINKLDRLSMAKQDSSGKPEYPAHIQKINSADHVPELIKDTLADQREVSRFSNYGDTTTEEDGSSYSKNNTLISLKLKINQGKNSHNLNASSGYTQEQRPGMSARQYDKLGSSLDIKGEFRMSQVGGSRNIGSLAKY